MKNLALTLAFCTLAIATFAQDKYFTRNGNVTFFSSTPVEDIKAINPGAVAVLDMQSGAIEVSMLNKSFEFKKALMQEHFNENYMESNTFPKSVFKGKIDDFGNLDMKQTAPQEVSISGELTIHGVTKTVTVPGVIYAESDKIKGETEFKVVPEDYGIKIPGMVRDNIAKEIEVSIAFELQPLKK